MSNNARLDKRREELKRLAIKAGYKSWYKFETAVFNHWVDLPPAPAKTVVKSKRTKGAKHA